MSDPTPSPPSRTRLGRRAGECVRAFVCSSSDPINLAVLRLVVFAWLILALSRTDFVHYTQIPPALRVPPTGYAGFLHLIRWDPMWVRVAQVVTLAACLSAFLGLMARGAALVACVGALYLLGLPELFGKVDHVHHHLIWFAALLAASRCGDALSIDALRVALRRADRGEASDPPGPSVAYGLPLRCVWLLIGVAYFFPGIAKLRAGLEWILSDNLKYLMHGFWAAKGFVPALRIDRYPLVYRAAAAATVVFEVGFLPALFCPRLRRLAVVGGVAFHILTAVYLRILFAALLACYVAFVDWAALLAAVGRRLFPTRLVVAYDGQMRSSQRLVAALKAVDVLRDIVWWDTASSARGRDDEPGPFVLALSPAGDGARAPIPFRLLARLPLALPILPVLAWLARRGATSGDARSTGHRAAASALGPAVVGGLLLAANIACGIWSIDSWPFSVFPRFAGIARPESTALEVVVRSPAGVLTRVSPGLRPQALVRLLQAKGSDQQARVAALQDYLVRHEVTHSAGEILQVYEVIRSTAPEDRHNEPLQRKLIAQLDPSAE